MNRFEAIIELRRIVNMYEQNILLFQSVSEGLIYVFSEGTSDWRVLRLNRWLSTHYVQSGPANFQYPQLNFDTLTAARSELSGSFQVTTNDLPFMRTIASHEWPLFLGGGYCSPEWEELLKGHSNP